uniref:Uncharacterized protein n=1 Tax=Crocodylus porosus TaxID=8502 RepID=A0A7M4E2Z8_CROPO
APHAETGRLVQGARPAGLTEPLYFSKETSLPLMLTTLKVPSPSGPGTAVHGAVLAELSIVPVHRGCWGNKIGKPHSRPCQGVGCCGSVCARLVPAPRGTGVVAGPHDCYASARGCTYSDLTPNLWKETMITKSPWQEVTDHLAQTQARVSVRRQLPAR